MHEKALKVTFNAREKIGLTSFDVNFVNTTTDKISKDSDVVSHSGAQIFRANSIEWHTQGDPAKLEDALRVSFEGKGVEIRKSQDYAETAFGVGTHFVVEHI